MAKLEKRQMIILGVMVLAILYGAYELLSSKKKAPPVDPARKTADLQSFVTDLSARTGADKTTALIFSRAEAEWLHDPFLDSKLSLAWARSKAAAASQSAAGAKKIEFVYSGYLSSGKKSMAVINGMEYKEGEPLDVAGFFLRSASPARVVIENRGLGTTLNIPMQE